MSCHKSPIQSRATGLGQCTISYVSCVVNHIVSLKSPCFIINIIVFSMNSIPVANKSEHEYSHHILQKITFIPHIPIFPYVFPPKCDWYCFFFFFSIVFLPIYPMFFFPYIPDYIPMSSPILHHTTWLFTRVIPLHPANVISLSRGSCGRSLKPWT